MLATLALAGVGLIALNKRTKIESKQVQEGSYLEELGRVQGDSREVDVHLSERTAKALGFRENDFRDVVFKQIATGSYDHTLSGERQSQAKLINAHRNILASGLDQRGIQHVNAADFFYLSGNRGNYDTMTTWYDNKNIQGHDPSMYMGVSGIGNVPNLIAPGTKKNAFRIDYSNLNEVEEPSSYWILNGFALPGR